MKATNFPKACTHMLNGRVPFKLCSRNFECKNCAYDQLLDDYDRLLGQENPPIVAAPRIKAAQINQVNRFPGYLAPVPAY